MIRRFLPLIFSALLSIGAASNPVFAAPPAAADGARAQARPTPAPVQPSDVTTARAGKVNVQILVVHATSAHSNVDPRLADLTRYLQNLRYSGYELLATQTAQLAQNGSQSFNIEGGRKMTVTMLDHDDQRARMRVQIIGNGNTLLDTTLSVNRNGTFIVAGPKYKDGILVLPLTARY